MNKTLLGDFVVVVMLLIWDQFDMTPISTDGAYLGTIDVYISFSGKSFLEMEI